MYSHPVAAINVEILLFATITITTGNLYNLQNKYQVYYQVIIKLNETILRAKKALGFFWWSLPSENHSLEEFSQAFPSHHSWDIEIRACYIFLLGYFCFKQIVIAMWV